MRRTANGLHTNETRKPARTGSVKSEKLEGAAKDQWASQAEPSGDWRRQLNGNKTEFAVLSDEGPTRPCAPGKMEETRLSQASQCPAVEHRINIPKTTANVVQLCQF